MLKAKPSSDRGPLLLAVFALLALALAWLTTAPPSTTNEAPLPIVENTAILATASHTMSRKEDDFGPQMASMLIENQRKEIERLSIENSVLTDKIRQLESEAEA